MNRQYLNSSNINWVEYDENTELLTVAFHSGSIYEYNNVGQHVYDGLISASSAGQYFYYNIKNFFPCNQIG